MYLDVLDFQMNFCLHLTFPNPVTAIYYNIIPGVFSEKQVYPFFIYVDVSKKSSEHK